MKLYQYLTDEERDILAIESACDVSMAENYAQLKMVCEKSELQNMQAEYKVIVEDGTQEDLQLLLEASAEDASNESGNIFSKIFARLKKFFSDVKNKITSLFSGHKEEEIVKAESVPNIGPIAQSSAKITALIAEGKMLIQKIISGSSVSDESIDAYEDKCNKVKKAGIAIAGGAAAISGVLAIKHWKKIKSDSENAEESVNKLSSLVDKMKNKVNDMPKLSKLVHAVSGLVSKSGSYIMTAANKIFKKKSDDDNTDTRTSADNTTTDVKESANDIFGLNDTFYAIESGQI